MATSTSWREMLTLMTASELRESDNVTLERFRWHLLEASAHLSTARQIIDQPSPALDDTEEQLLEPLESEGYARLIADLGLTPGASRPPGRAR